MQVVLTTGPGCMKSSMPIELDNFATALQVDSQWWGDHADELNECSMPGLQNDPLNLAVKPCGAACHRSTRFDEG